jgi:mycoredoxin
MPRCAAALIHRTSREGARTPMLTMYTTDWCGFCMRLKHALEREGITYEEVNIERMPDAAELVMKVNGGNRTVPTVVFADGTALTNPSVRQVKEKLAA